MLSTEYSSHLINIGKFEFFLGARKVNMHYFEILHVYACSVKVNLLLVQVILRSWPWFGRGNCWRWIPEHDGKKGSLHCSALCLPGLATNPESQAAMLAGAAGWDRKEEKWRTWQERKKSWRFSDASLNYWWDLWRTFSFIFSKFDVSCNLNI